MSMNRSLLVLLLLSSFTSLLSISLTLLKSRLSDVTEISVSNMLNLHWLWSYRWYLVGVVFIAVPWLMSSLMTAQIAKTLSEGTQTAVVVTLAAAAVGSILFFLQFFVYEVLRGEAIPPFGLNRVWFNIGLMACLSLANSYLALNTVQHLGSLQT
jgi:hypothetical protein